MGAMMGGCVGLGMGFIFGGYNMLKTGPGPNGYLRTLGQYMLGSAMTFGFFMSIGSAIRMDEMRRAEMKFNSERRRIEIWKQGKMIEMIAKQ